MERSKFRFGVSLFAVILFCSSVKAQVDTIDITPLKQEIIELKSNQIRLRKDINELTNKNKKATSHKVAFFKLYNIFLFFFIAL